MHNAVVVTISPTNPDTAIERLAVDPNDRELMTNSENEGGFWGFLAGEHAGIAYIDSCYVGVRWGSRPARWFTHDLDTEDEFTIIEAAINDELSPS